MSTTTAVSATAIETRNKESVTETVRLEQKEETVNSIAIVPKEVSSEDLAKRTQLYEFRSRQLFCKLIDCKFLSDCIVKATKHWGTIYVL